MSYSKTSFTNIASIDLIIGPMYAGKTTELLRKLSIYKEMGLACCYINSNKDTRSVHAFSSHNNLINKGKHITDNFDAFKVDNIVEILTLSDQYDVFGIDEAQMFDNLLSTVTQLVDNYSKKVIVSGLNGDTERSPFGEIIYLVPHAETICKLQPFCQICAKNKYIVPAVFTKNIVKKTNTILVGGKESYMAVCRYCYNNSDSLESHNYEKLPTSGSSSEDSDDSSGDTKPLIPPSVH